MYPRIISIPNLSINANASLIDFIEKHRIPSDVNITIFCDPDSPPLHSWEIEINVSFIPSISIMSSPNGLYNPVALDSMGGPKAGVALIPCENILCDVGV